MDQKTVIERESVEIGIDRNGNPKPEKVRSETETRSLSFSL